MRVTKDTVRISDPNWGKTVQLKDADPNELQLFIDKMPAPIKGKILKYNFSKLVLFWFWNKKVHGWSSLHMYGNR